MPAKTINGYTLTSPFELRGSARWAFASKNGKSWFIKEFLAPKWPMNPELLSKEEVELAKQDCHEFYKSKKELYDRVNKCWTGNIVRIEDFFRSGACYYVVTEKIPAMDIEMAEVSKEPENVRLILLKVMTDNLRELHENQHIVYADLRPDNILLKKTTGGITAKLIDFDSSFLEWNQNNDPPLSEVYCSPEVYDYFAQMGRRPRREYSFHRKIDVFSLGILFHLCWTGDLPGTAGEKYVCATVLKGKKPTLSPELPDWLKNLIAQMLQLDPNKRPDMKEVWNALQNKIFVSDDSVTFSNGFHIPGPDDF